jgi:hypothetical protein
MASETDDLRALCERVLQLDERERDSSHGPARRTLCDNLRARAPELARALLARLEESRGAGVQAGERPLVHNRERTADERIEALRLDAAAAESPRIRPAAQPIAEERVSADPLHPNGGCRCGGEGRCEWCVRTDAVIRHDDARQHVSGLYLHALESDSGDPDRVTARDELNRYIEQQADLERRARALCKARREYVAACVAAGDARLSNEAVAITLSRAKGLLEAAHDQLADALGEERE